MISFPGEANGLPLPPLGSYPDANEVSADPTRKIIKNVTRTMRHPFGCPTGVTHPLSHHPRCKDPSTVLGSTASARHRSLRDVIAPPLLSHLVRARERCVARAS